MGWAYCGTDREGRNIGYGIRAECDENGCPKIIDRGLGYCCGGEHGGSEYACGQYFCEKHLFLTSVGFLCNDCAELIPEEEDDEC